MSVKKVVGKKLDKKRKKKKLVINGKSKQQKIRNIFIGKSPMKTSHVIVFYNTFIFCTCLFSSYRASAH